MVKESKIETQYTFEIQPQSWHKRRKPTEKSKEIDRIEVVGFIKENNHPCQIQIDYKDKTSVTLSGRVYVNQTYKYEEDGTLTRINHGWRAQGINSDGESVILKLIE